MGFKWQLLQEVSLNKVQILCQVDSCINPFQFSSDFLLILFQYVNSSSQSRPEMEDIFWLYGICFSCSKLFLMHKYLDHGIKCKSLVKIFFFFFNFLSWYGSLLQPTKMRELADQCFYYEQECPLKSNHALYWWRFSF